MSIFGDILILCAFLAEVALLARIEKRLWGTLFTPLNALSLPFSAILLITICMPSSLGFVPFYYPSLLIWMGGLALMAIPSWILGYGFRKRYGEPEYTFSPFSHEKIFLVLTLLLIVPFVFHLRSMISTSLDLFGSDEFGENFAVYGFFGHLLIFLSACSILCFTCVRKGNRILPILAITLIAALAFVNQVKSWVMIPLFAGFWLCLMSQKIGLSLKLIIPLVVGGITLFVGSYLVIFILGAGASYDAHMGEYIGEHVVHYITSGVLGLSEDLRRGILETEDPNSLFAPFVNLVHSITGESYITPINPYYLQINTETALDDNVRTYFGTIYVNSSLGVFSLIVLFWGFVLYIIRILTLRTQSIFVAAIDSWMCALLCMGWFEYYFFHVTTFEIPIFILLLWVLNKLSVGKTYVNDYTAQL
jgi:hypothetical protein